jgi:hypothetical protein
MDLSHPTRRVGGLLYPSQGPTNHGLVTLQLGSSYAASGAPDSEHRFIEVEWGFPGVLLGSRALRWMMLRSVLGDIAMLGFTCLLSHPTWGSMWTG